MSLRTLTIESMSITCLWCFSSNTSKNECTTKLTITNAHFEIKYLMLTDIGHEKQDYSNVTMNDRPTCTCYTCEFVNGIACRVTVVL